MTVSELIEILQIYDGATVVCIQNHEFETVWPPEPGMVETVEFPGAAETLVTSPWEAAAPAAMKRRVLLLG